MMKMRKGEARYSIRAILSSSYILVCSILLLISALLFSLFLYGSLRDITVERLKNTCISVADSVSQQLNQMNQISLNVTGSTELIETFEEYRAPSSAYIHNQHRQHLGGLMTSLKGFDFSIRQLNLYGADSGCYGIGEVLGEQDTRASDCVWYEDALAAEGGLVIGQPDKNYISLSRLFYNSMHVPIGFVEVLKYRYDVFSLALQPDISYPVRILIFDQKGTCLYPLQEQSGLSERELAGYYAFSPGGDGYFQNPETGRKEYISTAVSGRQGLIVLTIVDRAVFLQEILRFLPWILCIFVILLLLCLLISWGISGTIVSPIRNIYHFLSGTHKEQFELIEMPDTHIIELEKLKNSINENITSNRETSDTLMMLKEKELQAQMLALQSQMNPHFLYNSLSTISAMAEENLTEPVSRMCQQITQIMRYISSNREQRCTLEEELEICDMYLDCIRMRFGDRLQSRFDVEDEILDCLIPKLCIQLLVENAVKSVTTVSPPWRITVKGYAKEHSWYVTVSDNGPGFDPAVDAHLRSEMDKILKDGILPSLKIEGMGILNIFIRLYLLDGIPFIFDMGNLPEGGAYVTVGGKIRDTANPAVPDDSTQPAYGTGKTEKFHHLSGTDQLNSMNEHPS